MAIKWKYCSYHSAAGHDNLQRDALLQFYQKKSHWFTVLSRSYCGLACGFLLLLSSSSLLLLKQQQQHLFNGPLSGTTWVSWYQKGKTDLDFSEARDSEWQWHQLGHIQICISPQTDNHTSTPPLGFFTGQMPFLPPNQQRQSTEGTCLISTWVISCKQ